MIRSIPRETLAVDIVVAIALFIVLTPLGFALSGGLWMIGVPDEAAAISLVVSAILLCGGVAVARLSPGIALALAWLGAIAHMAGGHMPVPVNVAILIVLYATAAWGSTRVFWLGLASAITGGLVAASYLVAVNGFAATVTTAVTTGGLLAVIAILALGLAWVSGMLWRTVLRARGIRAAQERAELAATEEQERARIARDMHDIVAHSLAVVIAQADGARYAAPTDPDATQAALVTISQTSRAALSDVRMLLAQLRHRQSDGPQPGIADLEELFAQVRRTGVEPRVTIDPVPVAEPPTSVQLAVYRILQEALTNALRHGDGDVDVHLSWLADRVIVTVRNGASGAVERSDAAGHGIVGMRERAHLAGGTFAAERAGGTFTVQATLPLVGVSA